MGACHWGRQWLADACWRRRRRRTRSSSLPTSPHTEKFLACLTGGRRQKRAGWRTHLHSASQFSNMHMLCLPMPAAPALFPCMHGLASLSFFLASLLSFFYLPGCWLVLSRPFYHGRERSRGGRTGHETGIFGIYLINFPFNLLFAHCTHSFPASHAR